MINFKTKQLIIQHLKDFSFGIGLFITIFTVAALDAKSAWTAQMNFNDTQIERTDFLTVDKIVPQHNMAKFIRQSFEPEYAMASNTGVEQFTGGNMDAINAAQIYSSDALYLAFIAMLFASMFTLTIGFWRYARREYASPRRARWRRG